MQRQIEQRDEWIVRHIFIPTFTAGGLVMGTTKVLLFSRQCKGSCTQLLAIEVVVVAMATMPRAIIIAKGTALILD